MKIKPFTPASVVQTSTEAQAIYLNKSGIEIEFYPNIINFYNKDNVFSSLCWKGSHKSSKNEAIVLAINTPSDIVQNFQRVEFIPLNKGDTVIINKRIFTVDKDYENFRFMELFCVSSEQYADSIAQSLKKVNTDEYFWHISIGTVNSVKLCYVWVGFCFNSPENSIIIPVFPNDYTYSKLIDDIIPMNLGEIIIKNNAIYQICVNDVFLELEYLCNLSKGLPC